MNSFTKLTVVALCVLGGAETIALAQGGGPPTPEQAAQEATLRRQGLLKLVSWSYAPVGGMLKNQTPFDAATVQKSAARIQGLAEMLPDAFQTDTRKFQFKTAAKENIWTNQADFASKASDLEKAAVAMAEAAKGGDKTATMQAARNVGKACAGCHDNYREKL
jgi:cytochrome c556